MGLPSQQRFALSQLQEEDYRRARGAGSLDPARVAFFLDRVVGPPVEGHALVAKGNHRLSCECGKFTVWTWWSLRHGRLDTSPAVRHDAHRKSKSTS